MKKLFLLFMVLGITPALAESKAVFDPTGLWLTQNKRAVIAIKSCGDALCGNIHWIIEGGMQSDTKNPEESLRGQPICGLQIVQGLTQTRSDSNNYEGGHIYKADEGDIYNASLKMKAQDVLTVRGYIGVSLFGKSQKWTRVSAKDYPKCKAR